MKKNLNSKEYWSGKLLGQQSYWVKMEHFFLIQNNAWSRPFLLQKVLVQFSKFGAEKIAGHQEKFLVKTKKKYLGHSFLKQKLFSLVCCDLVPEI